MHGSDSWGYVQEVRSQETSADTAYYGTESTQLHLSAHDLLIETITWGEVVWGPNDADWPETSWNFANATVFLKRP